MNMKRQDTAMWVLGLLWFALGIASVEGAPSQGALLGRLAVGLVLLVSLFFVIFGLRPHHKTDHHPHHG